MIVASVSLTVYIPVKIWLFSGDKTIQHVKKNRDPRWGESFQFMLEEPPSNERLYVEVQSVSSKLGLLHPKVNKLFRIFHFHPLEMVLIEPCLLIRKVWVTWI